MPQPIDVGSILGGRYKVTGRILASAENDVILDGLDQVLNRPVSILVAAVENSQHLMQSAREVATGGRVSNVSILDLGVQDEATYLIASRTSPAELLDLVVPTEPAEEVYQEPFFTDTLGTEIFGTSRDPAPVDGPYVYEDNSPLTPGEPQPAVSKKSPPATAPATAAVPAKKISPAAAVVPPLAAQTAAAPKVTLWEQDDYGPLEEDGPETAARPAGTFPAELRGNDIDDSYEDDELDDDDVSNAPRTGGRWLTGALFTVLLIGALVFAVQHIGTLFGDTDNQAADTTTSAEAAPSDAEQTPSAPAAPAPVAPVIAGITDITAYAPGVQNYGEAYFPRLQDAFDGNKATYWPTVEYSGADFAGLNTGINLVVELAAESDISSVTINQLTGSGGQFNILTNSTPGLEGATKIGSGSFSAPDFTFTAPPGVKAKYVIISFTELPRLQPFVTYPYGLKITEISIK
ncbi:ABC transporter substrate-binding protein [Specibacter sp. NPDC057265]|uniref:ABC transporter substrate-binding protein n=1 Tax=Specibacter sp. NPDC057265 TaxID=3346075 RepID=UPI00362EA372